MLASLKKYIEDQFALDTGNGDGDLQHDLQLATSALAIDIARADDHIDAAEREHLIDVIASHFSLSQAETDRLVEMANTRLDESVSLYDFTRQLRSGLDRQERIEVIRLLWDIAWADDYIHKHEEHYIRKVADLLYVSHHDYIKAKLAAEQARADPRQA